MKYISLLALLFVLESPTAFCGESSTYQMQGLRLIKSSDLILIKHGLCIDENACVKKQLVFFKNTSSGIKLIIYGISDMDVISEITAACIDEYGINSKRMSIDVEVFREKREDTMGLIKPIFISPYIKLYLQGEQ